MLVAGEAVDARLRCGSAAAGRRASGPPRPRAMVPSTRGSSASQEADDGDEQQRGVDLVGVVVLGEGVPRSRSKPLSRTSLAHLLAQLAPALDRALAGRAARPRATARSKAAHTMTRECVKCRGGPRISHSPLSGSSQCSASSSTRARCSAQESSSSLEAGLRGPCSRAIITSPSTSVCRWPHRAVADAHRPGAGVAGQVVAARARAGRGAPSTAYMICRSSGSPATARSSQLRHSRASSS